MIDLPNNIISVGDDGEEFKVKKSSYSKKIKKQMNKEKMGRDRVENGKKFKNFDDTMKPMVKEKQITITNITNVSNLFYF